MKERDGDVLGVKPPTFDRSALAVPAACTHGNTRRTLAFGLTISVEF